jgi:hypothetical protein
VRGRETSIAVHRSQRPRGSIHGPDRGVAARIGIDDLTLERIALNQARFRAANERIEASAEAMGLLGAVPFICECADLTCDEIVRLSLQRYEEVRHNPRLFFVAPGHQALAVGSGAGVVVGEEDGYVLVETIGVAGSIAERDQREQSGG